MIIIGIGIYYYFNREMTIKETSLKEVFKFGNINEIEIIITDVLGQEVGKMSEPEEKNIFINTLRDEKIKPISQNDKTIIGNAHRIIIKYKNKYHRIAISEKTIVINNKLYKTDNNLMEKLSNVLNKYSKYYR